MTTVSRDERAPDAGNNGLSAREKSILAVLIAGAIACGLMIIGALR